jgi:hypothetical protein
MREEIMPYSLDRKAWIAWQFDCPERGEGAIQAFRRDDSPRHVYSADDYFDLPGLGAALE